MFEAQAVKLNLGAGIQDDSWSIEGYQNIDIDTVDLAKFPWPWDDDDIASIYAGHILEHFDRQTGMLFLNECKRILAPGGTLYLAVPDMDLFIDCLVAEDCGSIEDYRWRDLNHLLGGDESELIERNRHKYIYCWASLAYTLDTIGFRRIVQDKFRPGLDNPRYRNISLYARAVK